MAKAESLGHFYKRNFTCLVDGQDFDVFRMKPTPKRKFSRRDEFLDVDYFESDTGGEFTDYLYQEVVVCPGCGFASGEDRFFRGPSRFVDAVEFDRSLRDSLKKTTPERLETCERATDLYCFPRSLEDALLSYEVGIQTSRSLLTLDRRRFTSEARRIPSYSFKAARIATAAGRKELEEKWLRRALETLEDAVEVVTGSSLYRSYYQIIALSIQLGEDRNAVRDLHRMRTTAE